MIFKGDTVLISFLHLLRNISELLEPTNFNGFLKIFLLSLPLKNLIYSILSLNLCFYPANIYDAPAIYQTLFYVQW